MRNLNVNRFTTKFVIQVFKFSFRKVLIIEKFQTFSSKTEFSLKNLETDKIVICIFKFSFKKILNFEKTRHFRLKNNKINPKNSKLR